MSVTKKDLFDLQENILHVLGTSLAQQRTDIVRDIRDEMDARFIAFRNEIHGDMQALEERINANVIGLVSDNILPAIDRVHGRVDCLESRFDGLETRFDGLETRFDGLETRFDKLETKVDTVHQELKDTRYELTKEIRATQRFVQMPAAT